MSLAVPAEVLPLLGGMKDGDSPVLVLAASVMHERERWTRTWHPSANCNSVAPKGGDRLLVVGSEAALLRVLARHLGWDGRRRPFMSLGLDGGLTRSLRWSVHEVDNYGGRCRFFVWLPGHISAKLSYPEALAAAVVWCARCARVEAVSGYPVDDRFLERWIADRGSVWEIMADSELRHVLVHVEQNLGLSPLEVLP